MMLRRIHLTPLLVFVLCHSLCAAVLPIDESFDNGETSGDWNIVPDDASFNEMGLQFDLIPRAGESQTVGASIRSGVGSFSSRLVVSDLTLDDIPRGAESGSAGRIVLHHRLNLNERGNSLFLILSRETLQAEGTFTLSFSSDGQGSLLEDLPEGENIALEIQIEEVEPDSYFATFFYDSDIHDATPPVAYGRLPYDGTVGVEQLAIMSASTFGSHGQASGVIDHFSLQPFSTLPGDFDADGVLDADDIDLLSQAIREGQSLAFDLNEDGALNFDDQRVWVQELKQAYFGDANLDDEFASSDLVNVFTAGEYEDDIELNSTWATGDWNGDGEFTTGDLVLAFQEGGYEQGPRAAAVPEPAAWLLLPIGLAMLRARPPNIQVHLAPLLVFVVCHSLCGAVFPIDEPFDNGETPGAWNFAPNDASFNELGLQFDLIPRAGESQAVGASIRSGVGSFLSRLVVSDLLMEEMPRGAETGSFGRITLQHRLNLNEPGSGVRLILSRQTLQDQGTFNLTIRSADNGSSIEGLPEGENISLEIQFEEVEPDSYFATFFYDSNIHDATPPIAYGTFPYEGTVGAEQLVIMTASTFGSHGQASGVIDHFSLLPFSTLPGDFDADGVLDADDIDLLSQAIREGQSLAFDLNEDGALNFDDQTAWVQELKQTFFGDANLDGEFASSDLVNVFTAGEYEDDVELNSTWATGDWNGDGDFTTGDLVLAFQEGGYEQGPRAAAVPEPAAWLLLPIGLAMLRARKP